MSIKSRGLSRGLSLLKASVKAGSIAAKQFIRSDASTEDKTKAIMSQVKIFADELGRLKGSAMKVGQLISTYGEHFLPPEANKILKSLQQESPPLSWSVMERQLKKELGNLANDLEIEKAPLASASIGQVHKAVHKKSKEIYAVKIQYPNVDKAIESDLKIFKVMLSTLNLLPRGARMDQVFDEVKEMLYQEVDYKKEYEFTSFYYDELQNDSRFVVAKPIQKYCTSKVMVTEFIEGVHVDSQEVLALPQTRRNRLGLNYLDLYLDELIKYQLVQTDPHFGNYRVILDPKGENDQLVLFDFGAMRRVPDVFLTNYKNLIYAGVTRSKELALETGEKLGLVEPGDSDELKNHFLELCFLITEPFAEGHYNWGESDLPKRVAQKTSTLALNFKLRSPPRESVFLDRKLGGAFIFLKVLGCKLDARSLLLEKIK